MSTQKIGLNTSNAQKIGELAVAAPQVVAHRLARMALAGPVLSERDRKEFSGMILEKHQAFYESWMAMCGETMRAQQALFLSWLSPSMLQAPWSTRSIVQRRVQLHDAAHRVAGKGLAPVHKKAVSNAKRLSKTKLK